MNKARGAAGPLIHIGDSLLTCPSEHSVVLAVAIVLQSTPYYRKQNEIESNKRIMIEQSHSAKWQRRGKLTQPLARLRESPPVASTSISRNPPTGGFPPDLESRDRGR